MRHKAGWFIPQQLLALTHRAPEVTQEEFMEIARVTQACLQEVNQPFHMIIDNRNIKSDQVVSLDTILQFTPQLQALPLRWVILILPYHVPDRADARQTQQVGDVHLMYVDTLAAALDALQTIDSSLNWAEQDTDFFAKDIS